MMMGWRADSFLFLLQSLWLASQTCFFFSPRYSYCYPALCRETHPPIFWELRAVITIVQENTEMLRAAAGSWDISHTHTHLGFPFHASGIWKWKLLSRVWLFATPWTSPGQNTGVGSLSLLQGNFLTQKSNWGLLCCRVSEFMASHSFSFCFSITLAQPRLPLQKPDSLSFEGILDTRIHPAPPRHCLLWSRQLSPSTAPCRASLWDSGHLPTPTSTPTQVMLLVLLTHCCTTGVLLSRWLGNSLVLWWQRVGMLCTEKVHPSRHAINPPREVLCTSGWTASFWSFPEAGGSLGESEKVPVPALALWPIS